MPTTRPITGLDMDKMAKGFDMGHVLLHKMLPIGRPTSFFSVESITYWQRMTQLSVLGIFLLSLYFLPHIHTH